MAAKSQLDIIIGLTDKTGAGLANINSKLGDFGKKVAGIGTGLTAGLTAPLVLVGGVAVGMASDLEESRNKVDVVFGDMAGFIKDFADGSATSLGQMEAQVLEATGTLGNMLTEIGLFPKRAADMSAGMVTLSSDMASFNNASPVETLNAIQSAIAGEFEPLKKYGVLINQAKLEEEAMSLGLIKTKDEMTDAIKVQATYSLMLKQTQNAQGDFARTSDGMANQMRIVRAQIGDLGAEFGQLLLPIVNKVIGVIRRLFDWFSNLSQPVKTAIVVVAGVAAAIGPLLLIVGSLISAFTTIIPAVTAVVGVLSGPLLLIIGAVVGVIALLALAWKNNWGDIQGKTKAAIDFIRNLIQRVLDWIRNFWDAHGDQIKGIVQGIWDGIKAIFDWFVGIAREIFAAFQLAFAGDWEGFGRKLREVWDEVWEKIKEILGAAWDFIKTAVSDGIKAIIEWFQETDWKQVGLDIIQGIANGITAATQWVIDAVIAVAKAIWGSLKGFFGTDSPSRLMAGLGEDLDRGLGIGIANAVQIPVKAAIGVGKEVARVFDKINPGGQFGANLATASVQGRTAGMQYSKVFQRGGDNNYIFIQNSAAWAAWIEQQQQNEFDDIDRMF